TKLLEAGPPDARARVQETLRHWRAGPGRARRPRPPPRGPVPARRGPAGGGPMAVRGRLAPTGQRQEKAPAPPPRPRAAARRCAGAGFRVLRGAGAGGTPRPRRSSSRRSPQRLRRHRARRVEAAPAVGPLQLDAGVVDQDVKPAATLFQIPGYLAVALGTGHV